MSRKRRHEPEKQAETLADYYRLNKDAVEDLVTASEENSPPVSEEEIRKYIIKLINYRNLLILPFCLSLTYFNTGYTYRRWSATRIDNINYIISRCII